ncbi:bacteriohemerythrin [Candidatus Methylospira mobilis]|nr:bacteriohemerythrin [Candidatus Methylospira mobilis]WNV04751.1 bacteriohemerythrin [Candidatus Methylospira mobilis]
MNVDKYALNRGSSGVLVDSYSHVDGGMPFIAWSEFLSVGLTEVDEQHEKVVQLINELHDCIRRGGADIVARVLGRIIKSIAFNFTTEEGLMMQHGFIYSSAHLDEHGRFIEKAVDLQNRFYTERADIATEAMLLVDDWLYQHLMVSDKILGRHINAQARLTCPVGVVRMQSVH